MPVKKALDSVKTTKAAPKAKATPKPTPKPTKAHIMRDKTLVRVYSQEVHGDDFMELAKSFAKKHNATVE